LSTAKTLTKNIDFDIRNLFLAMDSSDFRGREGRWLESRSDRRGWIQRKIVLQIKRRRKRYEEKMDDVNDQYCDGNVPFCNGDGQRQSDRLYLIGNR
jgi:hypothetical protein